jgi:hypothetical protein
MLPCTLRCARSDPPAHHSSGISKSICVKVGTTPTRLNVCDGGDETLVVMTKVIEP